MNIEYMNDSEEGADDEYDANDSESGLSSAPTTPGSNAGDHGRPDAAAAANAAVVLLLPLQLLQMLLIVLLMFLVPEPLREVLLYKLYLHR